MTPVYFSPLRSLPCLEGSDGTLFFTDGDRGYVPDVIEQETFRPVSLDDLASGRPLRLF